jgi:hypothetical protein
MAAYQVSLIEVSSDWQPQRADDLPADPGKPLEVLGQAGSLFPALRQTVEFNQQPHNERNGRWAVVVEPGHPGQTWQAARICTPLAYKVMAIWWPEGWEPGGPLDVPNCVWKAQGQIGEEQFDYPQAVATIRGLNQQSIDQAAPLWYVVIAVENEPLSQTVSYDPAGIETTTHVRRLHVIRPEEGGGKGDCSACPAHSFECAKENWIEQERLDSTSQSRALGPAAR